MRATLLLWFVAISVGCSSPVESTRAAPRIPDEPTVAVPTVGTGLVLGFDSQTCRWSVSSVLVGSPAEGAGFQKGDVVIRLADVDLLPLSCTAETGEALGGRFARRLQDFGAGSSITVEAQRADETIRRSVKLETIESMFKRAHARENSGPMSP